MMRKLFRNSKTPSTAEGAQSEGSESKKDKKKKKSKSLSLPKSSANTQYPYLANIPQLARASDAEALATALAAEVVADNADAGIPSLLQITPAQVDQTNTPHNPRRASVLKTRGRLNSVSSDASVEPQSPTSGPPATHLLLASPPLSPRSNSVTSRSSRPRVHFDVSEKIMLEAQWYSHQQRFTISSGNFLQFERPPTGNYRFSTTTESIHTKGTLLQLVTSASSDDENNTWDSITALPLYAARYYNPNVTSAERTVYWEADIRSIGFSKFSSVDHVDNNYSPRTPLPLTKGSSNPPSSPKPGFLPVADDSIGDLGLSRSISHTNPPAGRALGSAIAIGFVAKSVTPDTVPFLRRRSSLRPIDEFPFPSSVSGDGIFWSSDSGGSVYISGHQTRHSVKAGIGDSVGIGITFKPSGSSKQASKEATPAPTPPTTPPPTKDSKEIFRRKSSAPSYRDPGDVPCADPKDLLPVSVEIFIVVNGEKKLSLTYPDAATNPFDVPIPEYMLGQFDLFPCLSVQGAGVECKTRIGQAVKWHGAGGSSESESKTEEQSSTSNATVEAPKKSGRWWSNLGH